MTAPIFKLLNASNEVKAFLKSGNILRVYEFGLAPDAPQKPYLVWQDPTADPLNNIDCPADTDHVMVQIDIYSDTSGNLRNIREAVRKALEVDNSCTVTRLNNFPQEPITKLYRTGFDSNWFVDR